MEELQKTILIAEDDRALNSGIKLSLEGPGLFILQAFTLKEARENLAEQKIDLLLLDVNFPDGNGMDFFTDVKAISKVPVIFLTANDLETDVVAGLEQGAEDYITKPFSLAILRARVNAALRRNYEKDTTVKFGDLSFDFDMMRFYKGDGILTLSKTEQKLLRLLVENRGKTVSREQIIDSVWPEGAGLIDENALSVTVKRLRGKLEDSPRAPKWIKTIYGIGYQWEN